jgi:hypothetical protein
MISEQFDNWNKTKTYKNVFCALEDISAVISRTNKQAKLVATWSLLKSSRKIHFEIVKALVCLEDILG